MESRAAIVPGEFRIRLPRGLTSVTADPFAVRQGLRIRVIHPENVGVRSGDDAKSDADYDTGNEPEHWWQCSTEIKP